MKTKVFIDGAQGTTGLRIQGRLESRDDLLVTVLPDEVRKDPKARKAALNECDIAILCLPDAGSIEAVSFIENDDVRIIDASTAHRTASGWLYGFPELYSDCEELFANAKRVAVPGCHASGFVATVHPLVEAGIVKSSAELKCFSITGYSGGGKSMIAAYGAEGRPDEFASPRQYGLAQAHKHLPEMVAVCGLAHKPAFSPIVCDFYSGMLVNTFLSQGDYAPSMGLDDAKDLLASAYNGPIVAFESIDDGNGYVASNPMSGKDGMQIAIYGNDENATLMARFDNLGKGASGAAIQCLNLMIGADMTKGLEL